MRTRHRAERPVMSMAVSLGSARQPKPSALVLSEPSCYHFRVLDPRLPLRRSTQVVHVDSRKRSGTWSSGHRSADLCGLCFPAAADPQCHRPIGSVTSNCSLDGASVEIGRDLLTVDREDAVPFPQASRKRRTVGSWTTDLEAVGSYFGERLTPSLANRSGAVRRAKAQAEAARGTSASTLGARGVEL